MANYRSPRAIHPRRLLDITWGSVLNGAKTKVQKLRLGGSIRNGITVEEFNSKIRTASPNIYVVDPKSVAKVVFDAYSLYGDYDIKLLEDIVSKTLVSNTRSNITMSDLLDAAGKIHSKMVSDLKKATETNMSYLSFRRAAASAGAELRRVLNIHKLTLITDPHNFINNHTGKLVYLSYSFETLKTELNNILTNAVLGFKVKNKVKSIPDSFKIGNLVDSGHVGLYSGEDFIGINMPAQIIHATIGKKFEEVEEALGKIDTHIEYGLSVKESFTGSGILLDLGFQFTVVMSGEVNRGLWKDKESKALYEHVKLATKKELTEVFKSKIPDEALINLIDDAVAKGIRNSPTAQEFIFNSIESTLLGKNTSKLNSGSSNKQLSKPLQKVVGNIIRSKIPKKSTPSIRSRSIKVRKSIDSILPTLQVLLDSSLTEQIKQNMQRPALQNRTGRFAESVKVERLSESRAGMITAFYRYMRSPYDTFSVGGQQYKRSRDPKTLISKSIREIVSTVVGNRLRAVSI